MSYEPPQTSERRPPELTFQDVASQQTQVPEHYPETFQPQPTDRASTLKRIGAVIAAVAFAILKFGAKLKGLLLLLPKLKVLSTPATMLVSVAAYSVIWGWQFALGFVLLLLVHEMGHVI